MRSGARMAAPARSVESLAAEFGAAYRGRTTRSEILMGDFYGGRPIILKFMPWWGEILEAGCGLGRYVFYLRRLGYGAFGAEVSEEALEACREYARRTGEDPALFRRSDVRALELAGSSLSGYLSLGVVEHFEEGPQKAFREAHRVLAPGGVAVICTPNRWSVEHLADTARDSARRAIKGVLTSMGAGHPCAARPFDQYWFSSSQLARFARHAGFTVTLRHTLDLKYAVHEMLKIFGAAPGARGRGRLFRMADALESSPARALGGLAFIIAIREGPDRRCFFCGEARVPSGSLTWTVPVCLECARTARRGLLAEYAPGSPGRFAEREEPGEAGQALATQDRAACSSCGDPFHPDPDFGTFGLATPTCARCLRIPVVRGERVLRALREQWRPRL